MRDLVMQRKVLIISARNFGDSAIITRLLNQIKHKFDRVDILTRKGFKPIFENIHGVDNIYTSNFPMGTVKNFGFSDIFNLARIILKLRKNSYDLVINNIGDFRENLLGGLIGGEKNLSVSWSDGHPFNKLIRPGFRCLLTRCVDIPIEIYNVYEAQDFIAKTITKEESYRIMPEEKKVSRVALHTGASQKSKLWEYANWIVLIDYLYARFQEKIIIFCTYSELEELEIVFDGVKDKIEFSCGSVSNFLERLRDEVDIFIGLDSFSIHAAAMQNVSNIIMLNGANDAKVWMPLNGEVVQKVHSCVYFPCYNKPKCLGSVEEYNCMRQISPEMVIEKIESILLAKRRIC